MLKASEGDKCFRDFCSSFQSLAAENWKEMRPKKELVLGVTREIYLLERVIQVGDAMVTIYNIIIYQSYKQYKNLTIVGDYNSFKYLNGL